MKKISQYMINELPYSELRKVCDLIYVDGPVLTHFRSGKKNLFLYLVDFDDEYTRWLSFKISEINLFNYLTGIISLRELILNEENEFVYFLDINSSFEHKNIQQISPNEISEDYLPSKDSFMEFEFESDNPYVSLFIKYKPSMYLNGLKKDAIYLKLESANHKHGNTVGLEEINEFIAAITNSYKSYSLSNFFSSFKDYIADSDKLKRTVKELSSATNLRAVHLYQGSFEIGLSLDKTMINEKTEDKRIRHWAKDVLDNYKRDVIELDYENEIEIKRITKKYSKEQRSKIYKPIFDLLKNESTNISFKDSSDLNYKRFLATNKEKEIIPEKIIEKIADEYELVKALLVVKKGEKPKRLTEGNTLFTGRELEETFVLSKIDFAENDFEAQFDEEITVNLKIELNNYILSTIIRAVEITESSTDFKICKKRLINRIIEILKN